MLPGACLSAGSFAVARRGAFVAWRMAVHPLRGSAQKVPPSPGMKAVH